MKNIVTLFFAIVLTVKMFSQCADTVNIYTFTHNNKTYEIVKELKTWTEAAACAVERGGRLVEINDIDEQNSVFDAIINGAGISTTYTSVANGGGIAYVWIGATDQASEGIWLWDGNNDGNGINFWTGQGSNGAGNGASVGGAYYNWGGTSAGTPKEPDNYGQGQHHAAIGLAGWPSGTTILGIAGEWNDIIGTSLLYSVIEKDSTTHIQNNDPDLNSDVIIYPNPSNGFFHFDIAHKLIEIYNMDGKLLKQFENTKIIDLTDLNKNIYFIRIVNDQIVKTIKIILN